MKNFKVMPSTLSGTISASPSKSHTLRAILFASLASGKSTVKNYLKALDAEAMMATCTLLGAEIIQNNDVLEITGVAGKPHLPDDVINAGNSGQVLRFVGAIAGLIDGHVVLTGEDSIRYKRPVKPLLDALEQLGAECISIKKDGYAPIIVKGPISSGTTILDGQDSQPVSGVLMAAAFLDGVTEIIVNNPGEKSWVALTLAWFDRLGISYTNENFEHYKVEGKPIIDAFEYTVPGDFSSIAYPLVGALITQSELVITNIDMNDVQGDKKIVDVLIKMGADISITPNELIVKPSGKLQGCEIDVNDFIDAVPILAVVGTYAQGTTKIMNAAIARAKESDRLATVTSELKKMGADIHETEDALIINESALNGATLTSHADHRIVMSMTVAALAANGETIIEDTDCVKKSYPDFFDDMKKLNCDIEIV